MSSPRRSLAPIRCAFIVLSSSCTARPLVQPVIVACRRRICDSLSRHCRRAGDRSAPLIAAASARRVPPHPGSPSESRRRRRWHPPDAADCPMCAYTARVTALISPRACTLERPSRVCVSGCVTVWPPDPRPHRHMMRRQWLQEALTPRRHTPSAQARCSRQCVTARRPPLTLQIRTNSGSQFKLDFVSQILRDNIDVVVAGRRRPQRFLA